MIEFGVLGPLTLRRRGMEIDIRTRMLQRFVALLLAQPGSRVPIDHIVDALWEGQPPRTARRTLSAYASRLRGLLAEDDRLSCRPTGYLIQLEPKELDSIDFESLLAEARQCGNPQTSSIMLTRALALWRGNAFQGFSDMAGVSIVAGRLEELRVSALEDRIQAELDGGNHLKVVGDISSLIRDHPFRERLRGQLMLALYRNGRRAEALDAYDRTYRLLTSELGVEPVPALQLLHQQILSGDPALAGTERSSAPVPHQLPPDVSDFTGRAGHVKQLVQKLVRQGVTAGPIAAIHGMGGIGKTALAVHVAHKIAESFPDGQLFVDLRGAESQPLEATVALARLLRGLGLEGSAIPDDLDDRIATYRTRLAGLRILIVLDNVANAEQIASLLPSSPSCSVLVTSRMNIAGLPGAYTVDLTVPDDDEAVQMLTAIVGRDRVKGNEVATRQVVELCGNLPLAIRISGARLLSRPHWTVDILRQRLEEEKGRLDELSDGAAQLRASLSLSYANLSAAAQRMLRALAQLYAPDMAVWTGAAMLSISVRTADDLVDELLQCHLVHCVIDENGHPRFGLHDLVKVYAREQAEAVDPIAERTAAVSRALSAWLHVSDAASATLTGGAAWARGDATRYAFDPGTLTDQPLKWIQAEQAALVASIRQAHDLGLASLCWELSIADRYMFGLYTRHDDRLEVCALALRSARRAGDRRGESEALFHEGYVKWARGNAEGWSVMETAIGMLQQLGENRAVGASMAHFAACLSAVGRLDESTQYAQQALSVLESTNDRWYAAEALLAMGRAALLRGDAKTATEFLQRALDATDSPYFKALPLRMLAENSLLRADFPAAERQAMDGVELARITGTKLDEVSCLIVLANAQRSQGYLDLAQETLFNAEALCPKEVEDSVWIPRLAMLRLERGRVHHARADYDLALKEFDEADDLLGVRFNLARVQIGYSRFHALRAMGNVQLAEQARTHSRQLFERMGAPVPSDVS